MNIIKKHKQKLIKAVVLLATVSIILFVLGLFVAVWWEISFLTALEFAPGITTILVGITCIPFGLYFLMKQKNNFIRFCDIYDDPDMKKHAPKVMFISLIKYLIVILIITLFITAPYGVAVVLAPLFIVTFYVAGCIFAYIKLWRYHGYSGTLLLALSVAAFVVSVLLSPFIRAGIWVIVEVFFRVSA